MNGVGTGTTHFKVETTREDPMWGLLASSVAAVGISELQIVHLPTVRVVPLPMETTTAVSAFVAQQVYSF